jgi:hypothetical protein
MSEVRTPDVSSFESNSSPLWGRVGVVSLSGLFVIVHSFCSETYDGARLTELTGGIAHIPYQFRALVPWIIRGVNRWYRLIFGDDTFFDSVSATLLGGMARNQFDNCDPTLLLMYLLFEFGALLLLIRGGLRVLSLFQDSGGGVGQSNRALFVLCLFVGLFWNYTLPFEKRWWYASDIVGLTFFTWGAYRILKGEWLAYGLLFFVGAWNKETVLFLMPLFYLRAIRAFPEPLVGLAAVLQLVVWGGVKYTLGVLYGHNRGFLFHPNIIENMELLSRFGNWLIIASCGCGLLLITLAKTFRSKDEYMKMVFWTYIIFVVGVLSGGRITELRAYGELLPLAAAVAVVRREEGRFSAGHGGSTEVKVEG